MKYPRFRSLRAKIIYQMLFISLLPILIIGGIAYNRLNRSVQRTSISLQESQTYLSREVVGANHANIAVLIAREIDQFIHERVMDVHSWAAAPIVMEAARSGYTVAEVEGLPELTINEIEARMAETRSLTINAHADTYLKQQLALSPHFVEVFFTDAHGYNVALSNQTTDFVQSDEAWWQAAWSTGIHLSEVIYDDSAEAWSVAISVRIDENQTGRPLGVMKGILSISLIQEVVDLHAIQLSDGLIVICTSDGLLLAETSSTHADSRIMNPTITPSNSDLAALSESLTESNDNGYYLGQETVAGFAQTARGGFFENIPGFDGFGWWIIVQQPKDEVFAPLDGLSKLANELSLSRQAVGVTLLGATLFIVIGVFITTFFVSRLISQPIRRLTHTVMALSRGNLAVRAKESKRQDEIGILGRGFNRMAAQLATQMDTLEEQVKLRTHELTQINGRLQQEIGERERAEEELQRHHHQLEILVAERTAELDKQKRVLQSILNNMSEGVIVVDEQEKFLLVNSAAEQMMGTEVVETHLDAWPTKYGLFQTNKVTPLSPNEVPLVQAIRGQSIEQQEFFMQNPRVPQGIFISATATAFQDEYQVPRGVVAVFRDITQRRRAEEALQKSEGALRQLHQIVSTSDLNFEDKIEALLAMGCHQFGLQIGILSHVVNEQCQVIAALSPENQLEKGAILALGQTYCKDVLRSEEPVGIENVARSEWRNHSAYPTFGLETYLGISVIVENQGYGTLSFASAEPRQTPFTITDKEILKLMSQWVGGEIARQRAEDALRQAQKMESLGVLAGGVAHDFNNLLVAMLGQAALAQAQLTSEHRAFTHIEKVMKAAEHAADLTRQMLAYSGRGHFKIQPIRLNVIIEENLHLFESVIPKNIQFHSELTNPLPLIQADAGQIQQVVMNLIINATEAFDSQAGIIAVRTHAQEVNRDYNDKHFWQYADGPVPSGHYVSLEVQDNGKGMDINTLSKIFDPFFTTKTTGRGLGLAAVSGIIRGHKGRLCVYSEVEKGTTFKIFFPADSQVMLPEEPQASDQGAHRSFGSVLVIDDEEFVCEAVIEILELAEISGMAAFSGTDGLALYQERMNEIGLVLLDLSMPGMSGEETLQELRKINPDVRVLLSSGYSEGEVTHRFATHEVAGFIQKPYGVEELIQSIQHCLEWQAK